MPTEFHFRDRPRPAPARGRSGRLVPKKDEQLSKVSGGVRAIRATGIRASGLRFNPGDFGKF